MLLSKSFWPSVMDPKERECVVWESSDFYKDLVLARAKDEHFDDELREYERTIAKNDKVPLDIKEFLSSFIRTKEDQLNAYEEVKEGDVDVDEGHMEDDNDPGYELFVKCLKEHGRAYALHGEGKDSPLVAIYEEDISLGSECDPEPKRKTRSRPRLKDEHGVSEQIPDEEIDEEDDPESDSDSDSENSSEGESAEQGRNKKVQYMASTIDGIEPDPDYLEFLQNSNIVDGRFVLRHGDHRVVFWRTSEENDQENETYDDDIYDTSSPDVEIIEMDTVGYPNAEDEFRQQVISVLKKPYNYEEYARLWQDIESSKPKYRHKDLRNGREISYPTDKDGKSYLDTQLDLKEKLSHFQHNEPKRLNLLRGYFFWLQNCQHQGLFKPWQDAECLSIVPGSY